jgi:hypothetical protein
MKAMLMSEGASFPRGAGVLTLRSGLAGFVALGLAACGGGSGGSAPSSQSNVSAVKSTAPVERQTEAAKEPYLPEKARALNARELGEESAAREGAPAAGKSGAAIAFTPVPVYRFFNRDTAAHFYTTNESERALILATMPQFSLEGVAFKVSGVPSAGLDPVHRFLNLTTGIHFYTISASEKAYLEGNPSQFHYEGIAYYANKVQDGFMKPLYRFYLANKGFHFYSASETEKDRIVQSMPSYLFENVAYYVIDSSYLPIPHTGVTDQQCYEAGSGAVVACGSGTAMSLNGQQDGHRTAINAMTFSEVSKPGGGTYTRSECVKDEVTGLIWEGKTSAGLRAGDNTYSNYDDVTKSQRSDGTPPTQAQVAAGTNTVGYANAVNASALCGFTDWRVPTVHELRGIFDYGLDGSATAWFPNSQSGFAVYWTSSGDAQNAHRAWQFNFLDGSEDPLQYRASAARARLVRGG